MYLLTVSTPWVEYPDALRPNGISKGPQLLQEYPEIKGFLDITNQPIDVIVPVPNMVSIVALMDWQLIDVIKADPDYIVWHEEDVGTDWGH